MRKNHILLVLAWLLASGPGHAQVVFVDRDAPGPVHDGSSWSNAFTTVQQGLNDATAGEEVWVSQGTYKESLALNLGVALYGGFSGSETNRADRDWRGNVTILDADYAGSVLVAPSNATATTRIDGFTIINGIGSLHDNDRYGGAIFCRDASPFIANNTIALNSCEEEGGAIYALNGSPVISNNTIVANQAGTLGGAISSSGSPRLINNVITHNAAGIDGGALALYFGSAVLHNNTISDNTAAGQGGGVHCFAGATPRLINNIVAFGSSGIRAQTGAVPVLSNNCVFGNTAYAYSGLAAGATDVTVDPAFVDRRAADYHLAVGSLCIDAGNNAVAPAGPGDMDGQARINNAVVDIGADEYYANTVRRVSPSGNDANDGSSWSNAFLTVQAAINASAPLDEVWVAAGTYTELLTQPHGVKLFGGFAGTETQRDQRDWTANETVLDGDAAGTVVTVETGAGPATRIDGFSIQSGLAFLGGGVRCVSASPCLANNTLTDNDVQGTESSGGAVYCSDAARPAILGNVFSRNTAEKGGAFACAASAFPLLCGNTLSQNTAVGDNGDGGAVFCFTASPTILSNSITENSAEGNFSAYGGAILCRGRSAARIEGNTLSMNTAQDDGGAIHLYASTPTIAGNTICDNTAEDGGGISVRNCNGGLIANNVLLRNEADDDGGAIFLHSASNLIANNVIGMNRATSGGGLYCRTAPPSIVNNTVAENFAAFRAGGLYCEQSSPAVFNNIFAFGSSGVYSDTGNPLLRHNCLHANFTNDYLGLTAGTGDIGVDPGFVDGESGDYHLDSASACINAGDAAVAPSWRVDLDGQNRTNAVIDIGADEYYAFGVLRVSQTGDDGNDGSAWSNAYATVQAALDAAAAPNEVWVEAGTYTERITLKTGVRLYGGFAGTETQRAQRDVAGNATVLDGEAGGSVVLGPVGAGPTTRIDGFTIRNGLADNGSGVCCLDSSPSIANNLITQNGTSTTNTPNGGGIYVESCSPSILRNTISENGAGAGGGIYCKKSSCKIADNQIANNRASNGGGGLIVLDSDSPRILRNAITGNSADTGGGIHCGAAAPEIENNRLVGNGATVGAGVYCWAAGPTLRGNVLSGNSAATGGGGTFCSNGSTPSLLNNTLLGCSAASGGGIHCTDSTVLIVNNIVAFGSSGIYGTSSAITFRNNCVHGNTDYAYSGVADPTGTDGNIADDPKLAAVQYGHTHIQPDSPCRDAGDSSVVIPGWFDIDQQARVQATAVDIGADESDGTVWVPTPVIVRVAPTGSDLNDGSSWAQAKRTIQAGVADAAALGGEVWVRMGIYLERVEFLPYAYVYGGFAGDESTRTERDWAGYPTIIDAGGTGTVATVRGGYTFGAIDGFTIRNGTDSGIRCLFSSPRLANNTISGNRAANGGGIYCYFASPVVSNSFVIGNRASEQGGGIYCLNGRPILANNDLFVNDAGTHGGGIAVHESAAEIEANMLLGNLAGSRGGAVYCANSAASMARNTLELNTATDGGGLCTYALSPDAVNNLLLRNTAFNRGGAIACMGGGSPWFMNNTIAYNTGANGGGLYAAPGVNPTIVNSILWENGDDMAGCDGRSSYCCVQDGDGGTGNTANDPLLMTGGRIGFDSSCRNAGDAVGAPTVDRERDARPTGAGYDIGADEFLDRDGDQLADAHELELGLDPDLPDTDGDTHEDGAELAAGTDPLNPADYPLSGLAVLQPDNTTTGIVGKPITVSWRGGWALGTVDVTLQRGAETWLLAHDLPSTDTNMSAQLRLPTGLAIDTNYLVRVSGSVLSNDNAASAMFATRRMPPVDLDGDGRSDLGVYFPPGGNWYVLKTTDGFEVSQFGFAGTIPVTGDYDGDGQTDFGVYHPASGMWYVMQSLDGFVSFQFGYAGTTPVSGDFDGDGICDYGVYFADAGNWTLMNSTDGLETYQFGYAGTVPITGDFDGDGLCDFGVYFAPGGNWYVMKSTDGFDVYQFGYAGTVPITGDMDGDGLCDFGVYFAPGGNWYVMKSAAGFDVYQFGFTGTVPIVGDYDGDGSDDFGVYYAPTGDWYVMRSSDGFWVTQFGYAGTIALGSPPATP